MMGYFSENVKHDTFPEKKNLSTEKTEKAVKWIFKFCCVYAPIALVPQFCLPGLPAISQKSLLDSGKAFLCQENGEGEKKRTGCMGPQRRVLTEWYNVRYTSQKLPNSHCRDQVTASVHNCSALQPPGVLSEML